MVVKNRLREILSERGISQTWLAKKVGIDRSTLSTVVANKKGTNLETAMRIADVLNMKMEEIFELIED